MKISINEKIKQLRNNKKWTQEELAEKLNISTQAVSRWETKLTYPDIELLPEIATLFEISVDELLGVEELQNNNKINQYLEEANKYYHTGEIKKMIMILEQGIKEYPTNIKLIIKLIQVLYSDYDEDRENTCKKIIKLADKIIDNLKDINEKCSIYQILSYTYLELNDKEKALQYINKLPDISYSSNFIKPLLLDDDNKIEYLQYHLQTLMNYMVITLKMLAKTNSYSNKRKIEILNKAQSIIELIFENKDYGYEFYLLEKINLELAINYALEKDDINTIYYLKNAFNYAKKFDNLPYEIKHTSIVTDKTNFILEKNFGKDYQNNELVNLQKELKQECFNFLKNNIKFEEFISK